MTVKEMNIVKENNIVEEINKNLEALDKKLDSKIEGNKAKRIEIQETLAREGLTPSVVLHELTHDICHREVNEEELERFSKEHLDSLSAQLEATKEYAERYSKTLPERAFCKAKSIALDGLGWIDKVTA